MHNRPRNDALLELLRLAAANERGGLFASPNNAGAPGADSGNEFGADFLEQSERQRPVGDAC